MKLARREKIFIYSASALIFLFLIIELLIVPLIDKKAEWKREIIAKERGIEELEEMSRKYQKMDKLSGDITEVLSGRKRGFTLFSFLETAAGQAGVKSNIKDMKPSESKGSNDYTEVMVEMKLEAVTLDQLTEYLYLIENPDQLIFVKRISLTDNKREKGHLDSILQVLTFK
jgi:general secretion pathway protein M